MHEGTSATEYCFGKKCAEEQSNADQETRGLKNNDELTAICMLLTFYATQQCYLNIRRPELLHAHDCSYQLLLITLEYF